MPVAKRGLYQEQYEQWDFTLLNNGRINNTIWRMRKLTAKGLTALRVIPEVYEGIVSPQYVEDDNGELALSGFYREAKGLDYAGPSSITFLTEPKSLPDECKDVPCPTSLIIKTVRDRVIRDRTMSFPRIWEAYTKPELRKDGSPGYKDAMHKPTRSAYLQCIITMVDGAPVKGKDGSASQIYPGVLKISQSTALSSFFTQLRTPANPDECLSAENCLLGDITSCEGGRMLMFNSEKEYSEQLKKEQDKYTATAGELWELGEEFVKGAFLPWEKVLNYLTLDELLLKLSSIWDPSAVVYGLKDTVYEPFVPQSILDEAVDLPADSTSAAKAPARPAPRVPQAPPVPKAPPKAAAPAAPAPVKPATKAPPPPAAEPDDAAEAEEAGLVGTPPPPAPAARQAPKAPPPAPKVTPPPAPKAGGAASPKARLSQAELQAMIAKARSAAPPPMRSAAPAAQEQAPYQPTEDDLQGVDFSGDDQEQE